MWAIIWNHSLVYKSPYFRGFGLKGELVNFRNGRGFRSYCGFSLEDYERRKL